MKRKIILSVDQARDLQAEYKASIQQDPRTLPSYWGKWTYVMSVSVPETPDNIQDMDRIQVALKMAAMGCTDMQIAESLHWKYPGVAIRAVMKLARDAAKVAAIKAQ